MGGPREYPSGATIGAGVPVSFTAPTVGQVLCYDGATARWRSPDYIVTFAGLAAPGDITTTPPAHAGDAVISIFDAAAPGLPLDASSFSAVAVANGVHQTSAVDLNAHSYLALVRPAFPT